MSVNSVSGSPVGIRVIGNTNDLKSGGSVSGNSGNGVEVGSSATGNTVRVVIQSALTTALVAPPMFAIVRRLDTRAPQKSDERPSLA